MPNNEQQIVLVGDTIRIPSCRFRNEYDCIAYGGSYTDGAYERKILLSLGVYDPQKCFVHYHIGNSLPVTVRIWGFSFEVLTIPDHGNEIVVRIPDTP